MTESNVDRNICLNIQCVYASYTTCSGTLSHETNTTMQYLLG